jgi:hypothetical protein
MRPRRNTLTRDALAANLNDLRRLKKEKQKNKARYGDRVPPLLKVRLEPIEFMIKGLRELQRKEEEKDELNGNRK